MVPVKQAFANAWLGIGVSEALDGELLVADGVVWRVRDTGIPELADPDLLVPFAISEPKAPASEIHELNIPTGITFDELGRLIAHEDHGCVTVRIEGEFRDVTLRSEHRQAPPYRHLDDVLSPESDQEVRFEFSTWRGVMVGYRFPDPRNGSLIPGLHLHAISADKKSGGHVRAMVISSAQMTWAPANVRVTHP